MLQALAPLGRLLVTLWHGLDSLRRVLLNLLLAAVLLAALAAWLAGGPRRLDDKTALVLSLDAPIVEQYSGSVRQRAVNKLQGDDQAQIRLRDLLAALDDAAANPRVDSVLLLTDGFVGAGLPTLREVAAALQRVKAAGKKVRAWGHDMNQRAYLLAAQADEVLLDPMGAVRINGFGLWRNYYGEALDKLGVQAHVIRAGRYKSAAEPLSAKGPSPETQEAEAAVMNDLWADYTRSVEAARRWPAGRLAQLIDETPQRLAAAAGNPAKAALDAGLVDRLLTRDQLRELMLQHGARDDEGSSFRQVGLDEYLSLVKPRGQGDAVAVVVAQGSIVDGKAPAGQVGGLSTGALLRQLREDKSVKAVVLRVNSPGGSAYGSELVREQLQALRKAGKPVVVSMGDLAASGGYWVSLAADEVLADPATITGSIGVISMMPVASDAMARLGVHNAGSGTTWLAGAYDPRRGLDPRLEAMLQQTILNLYGQFLDKVAESRKRGREDIDRVAQGRIWTGAQARQHGLVDGLGGLGDAVKAAARRAGLPADHAITYPEVGSGRLARWLQRLDLAGWAGSAANELLGDATDMPVPLPAAWGGRDTLRALASDLQPLLDAARSPGQSLVHCLCSPP